MHGHKILKTNALVIVIYSIISKKGTDFEFEFPFSGAKVQLKFGLTK